MYSKDTKPPFAIRQAALGFNKSRSDYYFYVAGVLERSGGRTKLLDIFEKDARRYEKKARGKLSAYWAEKFANNGADLAAAWRGTFPDDEVSIINVGQGAGANGLVAALKDVGRIAALSDRVKSGVIGTIAAAVFGLTLAVVMLTLFPMFSAGKLQEIYSFIPLSEWGTRGKFFNAWAENVRTYGLYFVGAFVLFVAYIGWTVNNLTGTVRDWLDRNIVLYKVIRDVKGALFLATMATLTRKRGNLSYTLSQSLQQFAQSIRSPWLKWRVEEVAYGVETTGGTDSKAFETNLLSETMYFYLCDMQEANGFAQGFEETGRYVESEVLGQVLKRMSVYKWVMLVIGVLAVLSVMGMQISVIFEMKGVMMNYYSSK